MKIYPAIDLLNGSCVRLKQGDFQESTVYSQDPLATLRGFEKAGASYLHLVDLSGAKNPEERQLPWIQKIIAATKLKVQVGGGIRNYAHAAEILHAGADCVVIGSASVSNPKLVQDLLKEFGADHITVALDIRIDTQGEAKIASHGWQTQSTISIADALAPLLEHGLKRVLCTDIARDGMMLGPNLMLYQKISAEFPQIEFQASGGMSSIEDLKSLKAIGMNLAIIGKAIYTGAIQLEEALQC